ncbi:DNA methyltransferase [Testudinibacter sp. P80/BLE/0925]|uniref:DNA methyltransferase n=1 Tax=Testudinibacter sp. TW-1 TaxID=3417757 RepID=UPI003D359B3B
MIQQIKSKKRVADHGEVFTRRQEVKAMLDLMKDDTEKRDDSRYLEPACGDGNFLIEILARKLAVVEKIYHSSQREYEFNAVFALACLYGIELLQDNVIACRKRLLNYFQQQYERLFAEQTQIEVLEVAEFILSLNILHGNALTMKNAEHDEFLHFSEWSKVSFPRKWSLKRHDWIYQELIEQQGKAQSANGEPYRSIQEYFSCYFLDIKHAKPVH